MRIATRRSPQQRTLAHLRAEGWTVDIAERRQGPISRDLFGCIDVVAVHPLRREFLFVQLTGDNGGHVADRVRKVRTAPATRALLRAGARVEVWGWAHGRAEPRIVRMTLQAKENR